MHEQSLSQECSAYYLQCPFDLFFSSRSSSKSNLVCDAGCLHQKDSSAGS